MSIQFSVPTSVGPKNFDISFGETLYFVGANGGGKTRLAVLVENDLGVKAHRISAHRALSLNPQVAKISEAKARKGLKLGHHNTNGNNKSNRWGNNAPVMLLNDFDFLVQTLFAEQSNTALKSHKNSRSGAKDPASETIFEKLEAIWRHVLPHRILDISGDDITVSGGGATGYPAADMSDGERATFYLIGQTLAADAGTLIIFDEPELHLHRAIMSRLWDEIEAARPDCAMMVISHDLEFIASRSGTKFALKDYSPPNWEIEEVPADTGFSEELTTLILGSRRPILFVEGDGSSLDQAIYRACYPGFTIIPRGSCENVIHAVATLRENAVLTRVTCAGIVDADDYSTKDIANLNKLGIAALSFSEIENVFLMPDVLEVLASGDGHDEVATRQLVDQLKSELFAHAADARNQKSSVLRYARRRIDRVLKKLDFSPAKDAATLAADYAEATSALNVAALAQLAEDQINDAINAQDAAKLLKWYDNKGILNIAGKAKGIGKVAFEQWIVRVLKNENGISLKAVLLPHLPTVTPK
jgi:hypothetical protein